MPLVRVHNFAISLDGFGAGEGQSLEAPFGHAGSRLMEWAFPTRTFASMGFHGEQRGSVGVDEAFASRWNANIGAEIMGRNKFAPKSEPWPNEEWQGWWGDNPPFRTPVVVLTSHPRPPLELEGGNVFHFVDAEPAAALEFARELAGGLDVRIGGRNDDRAGVSAGRSDRRAAPRRRADRARTGREALARARSGRKALRHRVGDLSERRHPSVAQPPCRLSRRSLNRAQESATRRINHDSERSLLT